MDRHKIVNIISSCRRQKGVRQADLCRGICSVASYSRIESGEAVIPLVMAQTFLERLGTDPGQLEQLLEGEDYGCHQKRQDIEAALRDGQAAQAEQLLAAYKEAAGEDKLEIQYVKYCQARIGRLRMRQDASLDLEARGQLAGETERLLQEAESLTIPKRGRGMLLSRVELGILLAETEGIGLDEMQNIQDFVREYYNMEWKEEYLPQVHLKYANLLAGEGKYGRALAEIQRGLASVRSGESYGHCADLYFLSAQIAGRMGWERLGKEEQKELARKCWRAYSLYSLDRNPRAEAVREYMETSGLMALAPESLL